MWRKVRLKLKLKTKTTSMSGAMERIVVEVQLQRSFLNLTICPLLRNRGSRGGLKGKAHYQRPLQAARWPVHPSCLHKCKVTAGTECTTSDIITFLALQLDSGVIDRQLDWIWESAYTLMRPCSLLSSIQGNSG
ncbi:hypothetical protein MRB53_041000 [Persea americana]|nr:hypothetical protein MRB53_041000 [Persea americana]